MEPVLHQLVRQHGSLAGMLRRTFEAMSEEEFSRPPGVTAPPAGWHLWHIARWADRFQATLANASEPPEIWMQDALCQASGLDPDDLGVLQLGMGMDVSTAQALPATIGRQRFSTYMERVLDALQAAISGCDPASLTHPRMSIREYANVNGVLQYAAAQESILLADVLFHLTHASRHLGSIEALRGLRATTQD